MFPEFWKTTRVVTIPKKGDYADIINHSTFDILSSTAKVVEGILYNRLLEHVRNFITPNQYGYFPADQLIPIDYIFSVWHELC